MSLPVYYLVLPDGKRVRTGTRREAMNFIIWAPAGTKIDPPIPHANPVA